LRTDALDSGPARQCWHEWSIEPGTDLDDPDSWAQANPALGKRVGVEELAEDRAAYSDEGFARERCGMWSAESSAGPVDPQSWAAVADPESQIVGRPVAAIDVAPDNRTGSVCVAGRRADGRLHGELVENRAGCGWIVDYMKAMHRKHPLKVV